MGQPVSQYTLFGPATGDEFQIVSTPPFAESVTEGDVKWEKGGLVDSSKDLIPKFHSLHGNEVLLELFKGILIPAKRLENI